MAGLRIPREGSSLARCLETGQPQMDINATSMPEIAAVLTGEETNIQFPLQGGEVPVGVLHLCVSAPHNLHAWLEEKAMAYIREQVGKHFDPQVVEVFLEMVIRGRDPGADGQQLFSENLSQISHAPHLSRMTRGAPRIPGGGPTRSR